MDEKTAALNTQAHDAAVKDIAASQAAYYAKHGCYYQVVAPEVEEKVELGLASVARVSEIVEPEDATSAFEVNEYRGPYGAGYEVVGTFSQDGVRYRRVIQVGPEEHRNCDWTAEDEGGE